MNSYRTLLNQAIEAALAASVKILEVYAGKRFRVRLKRDFSPVTLADMLAHGEIAKALSDIGLPLLSEEGTKIPYEERKRWERFWLVDPLDGTKEFIKRNGDFTVNIALIEGSRPTLGVILAPVTGECWYAAPGIGARYTKGPALEGATEIFGKSVPLPFPQENRPYRIIASRSHLNPETQSYIMSQTAERKQYETVNRGSSLKLCMIAEGTADLYPRFGPTMEWDTAAGDAIVTLAGGKIENAEQGGTLLYNKPDLRNPSFIASSGF